MDVNTSRMIMPIIIYVIIQNYKKILITNTLVLFVCICAWVRAHTQGDCVHVSTLKRCYYIVFPYTFYVRVQKHTLRALLKMNWNKNMSRTRFVSNTVMKKTRVGIELSAGEETNWMYRTCTCAHWILLTNAIIYIIMLQCIHSPQANRGSQKHS